MKLLICGDSFTQCETVQPWAWYKKVADELDAEIINLSIVGASNFNIWHQIAYAKQHMEFDAVLVSLTRPNRVEKVLADNYDTDDNVVDYTHFTDAKIKSWAIHEWIENGEYPLSVMEKFSPLPLAVSRDRIVVNDILTQLGDVPHCVINNLFTEYVDNVLDISLSEYSDLVTGDLDEPQVGHLYRSMHEKFFNEHGHLIVSKLAQ